MNSFVSALPLYNLLDPRPASEAAAAPILDSVNIPSEEIHRRTHELPRAVDKVRIVDTGSAATRARLELANIGRSGVLVSDWRYADGPIPCGRLWSPTSFLRDMLPELGPAAAALDLACGAGRDAVFLAAHGWAVIAIDHDRSALERGADLARRYAPTAPAVQWVESDLERGPLPPGPFNLITCFRFLSRPLLAKLASILAPHGSVLIEAFTPQHRERHGRPRSDDRVAEAPEITEMLQPLEIRLARSDWHADAHTTRVWATAAGSHTPSSPASSATPVL